MSSKRILAILMVIMVAAFALAACGRPAEENQDGTTTEPVEQSITVNGSTSVQPLAEELAKAFKAKNPNIIIDIQGGGSGVGIKSANDGVVDIGMSSRELKTEEKNLKEFKIALDGIAVVLNPANPITDLTMEQIQKIYTGEITDWSQVGGTAGKITVVTREEGSGTRGAFIELTGVDNDGDKTTATAITQGSTGAVMTTVSSDPNAIGYASFGSAKENTNIKMIKVNGVEASEENISAGTFKISRPFLMLTKEEPTGAAKDFLDFILSTEGQEVVASHNYLKVK
ncbi:MAG: phosphate transporter substrate-binding protein [Clostridia bacterium]|jgi:phosphate transport system substrate-binding protein|nr:phosphate transporter substrate-binding protein [Clostridia bacterium]